MSDISERFAPFNPLFAIRQESSYTKNEYNFLYHKLDTDDFFIQQFFQKSGVFREN